MRECTLTFCLVIYPYRCETRLIWKDILSKSVSFTSTPGSSKLTFIFHFNERKYLRDLCHYYLLIFFICRFKTELLHIFIHSVRALRHLIFLFFLLFYRFFVKLIRWRRFLINHCSPSFLTTIHTLIFYSLN
jgi:hypothetical protein